MLLPIIFIKDRATGTIREVGSDVHDKLYLDQEGHIQYYNMQNGCSSEDGTYEFLIDEEGHNHNNLPFTEEERIDYLLDNTDCCFGMVESATYGINKMQNKIDSLEDMITKQLLEDE
jgi:hypothetical protein